jgi:hypothetical protein
VLPSQSFARTEHVTVTVVDANGIAAEAATSLPVIAQPAPDTHNSVTYGCKSPDDPGAWTGDRVHWRAAMSVFGGGSERFCWLNDSSWPGDFIEPPVPGGTEPHPWINGDADYQNWGINTANIVFYIGDSNPWGLADMYPGASPSDYNTGSGGGLSVPGTGTTVSIGSQSYTVNYTGHWGSPHPGDRLQWLAMYACNLLERSSSAGDPWNRWGPAFNGLHSLMSFQTEAGDNIASAEPAVWAGLARTTGPPAPVARAHDSSDSASSSHAASTRSRSPTCAASCACSARNRA